MASEPVALGLKRHAEMPSDDEEEYEEESSVKKKAKVGGTDGKVPLAVQPCTQ